MRNCGAVMRRELFRLVRDCRSPSRDYYCWKVELALFTFASSVEIQWRRHTLFRPAQQILMLPKSHYGRRGSAKAYGFRSPGQLPPPHERPKG